MVNADLDDSAPLDINLLVDQHYDYLYRYAFRYFSSSNRAHSSTLDLAEDLVQETFLAAMDAIKRFKGKASPRTWLTSILRHKIMDKLREKNREEPVDFEKIQLDPLAKLFDEVEHWHRESGPLIWGACPDKTLKQKDFLRILGQCLKKLPEKMRQVFLLRELEGFEREEICKQFSLTSSNVGVLLHRSRLSLQSCLQVNWFHVVASDGGEP